MPGLSEGGEVFYAVLPLFHAYGMTLCLTFAMSIGATRRALPEVRRRPRARRVREEPGHVPAGGSADLRCARPAAERRKVDLSGIRFAISGAMSLPVSIVERWETATGGLLVEGYGMTESSPVALGNPIGPSRRPGTVGVPFPSTEIRVVDPADPAVDRGAG